MPGFLVNRILIPMLDEACFALQEGLGTPEDIDTGAKLGLNHPMGPLELADLIGLDTMLFIAEAFHREFGDDKYRPADAAAEPRRRGLVRQEDGARLLRVRRQGHTAPEGAIWMTTLRDYPRRNARRASRRSR